MDRAELIAIASPPCHECGEPVVRVEQSWRREGDGWVPGSFFMVCASGHHVLVEPL